MPGRGTDVNYIVASEILHSMKTRKGKKGFFAIKIDLEKAYDRMEWGFIRKCLIWHNFDEKTISLIMSYISSTSTCIKVNGSMTDFFYPSRGLRQGDPLSPYVFILCMEYLSYLINEACDQNHWIPFSLPRKNFKLSHLLFADDLLLFGATDFHTLETVQNVLDNFHALSGQKVNPDKSIIYFSKNTLRSENPDC